MAIGTSQSICMPSRNPLRGRCVLRPPLRGAFSPKDMGHSLKPKRYSKTSAPFGTPARLAALNPRHGLQHPAHRRRILLAISHREGSGINRNAGGKQRGWNPELGGMIFDHGNVLVVELDAHAGIVITVLHHHWATQFEHPRSTGAGADEVVD